MEGKVVTSRCSPAHHASAVAAQTWGVTPNCGREGGQVRDTSRLSHRTQEVAMVFADRPPRLHRRVPCLRTGIAWTTDSIGGRACRAYLFLTTALPRRPVARNERHREFVISSLTRECEHNGHLRQPQARRSLARTETSITTRRPLYPESRRLGCPARARTVTDQAGNDYVLNYSNEFAPRTRLPNPSTQAR